MYNLRYHIASLVGVFLALALGLVLGGLVVQRGTVDRNLGNLVEGLGADLSSLRSDNRTLTQENTLLSSFSDDMSEAWIADKLVGRNVIVLTGEGRSDGLKDATDAVRAAGGTAVVVTVTKQALGLDEAAVRSAISSATQNSPELQSSVAASLAAEWVEPAQVRPVTEALVEAGALTVDGFEPGMATVALVDIASTGSTADTSALDVAVAFAREDGIAIGAESATRRTGVAAAAAGRDLPSLDTLGTALGRYTLVALMTGADPRYYGVGEGASEPYPAPVVE